MMHKKFYLIIPVILTAAFLDPYADRVGDGNSSYHAQKYQDAEKSYAEAENYMPSKNDISDLSFNKGDARFKMEDFDGAIEYYKQALGSQNRDVQKMALFNIGNAYVKKGDKSAAADAFMAALRIDPKYLNAKKNLENLYRRDDKKDKDKKQDDKDSKNGEDKKPDKSGSGQNADSAMSKDQIKNMMQMMKDKPVRRQRKDDGKSMFGGNEKPW